MTIQPVPHFVFPWSSVAPSMGLQMYSFPYISSTGRNKNVKTAELVSHKMNPLFAIKIYKIVLSIRRNSLQKKLY